MIKRDNVNGKYLWKKFKRLFKYLVGWYYWKTRFLTYKITFETFSLNVYYLSNLVLIINWKMCDLLKTIEDDEEVENFSEDSDIEIDVSLQLVNVLIDGC